MNCLDCREWLPACADGELDAETKATCDQHLTECQSCRAEYAQVRALRAQLVSRGEVAAGVGVVASVMSRILTTAERKPARSWRKVAGWIIGAGALATGVIVWVVTLTVVAPQTNAQAAEVMTRGINAVARLANVHIQARMRTPPNDNFSAIDPSAGFVRIELWREFGSRGRWRVEKPGRIAAMDGTVTRLFIRPDYALEIDRPASAAFDTGWLQKVADIEQMLTSTLRMAQRAGWKMSLTRQPSSGGQTEMIVTVDTNSARGPEDYLANRLIGTGNLRQVYRFDDASGRLEALQIYLKDSGALVFETTRIDYDQELAASTFAIELPPGIVWSNDPPKPVAARYTVLTAETAARMFLEACGREDWTEASVFVRSSLTSRWKTSLGGIQVLAVGESFTAAGYPGRFVPYEIKFRAGAVKKFNLALKHDPRTGRWFIDGGI